MNNINQSPTPLGMSSEGNDVSRRNFLRTLAVASGAALAAPVAPIAKSLSDRETTTAQPIARMIGVMIDADSLASESIVSGIQFALDTAEQQGLRHAVTLAIEDIGPGTARIGAKARRLLDRARADIILAHVNSYASAYFSRALDTQQAVVIEMNAGESIPSAKAEHPFLFRSTLNLWEANVALGVWAARHVGKRAVVCTSHYNAGFGFHEAFRHGFESSGGELLTTRVTNGPMNTEESVGAIDELRELKPDVLFASYASHDARYFMQLYQGSGLSIPVFGTNFHDDVHARGGERTVDAWARSHSYASSWSPELATEENAGFMQAYAERTGQQPNAYAVLGYDTAMLVLRALASAAGTGPEAIRRALAGTQTNGPRGCITMDAQSQSTTGPAYRITGGSASDTIEPMTPEAGMLQALRVHHAETPAGGWLNAYEFA